MSDRRAAAIKGWQTRHDKAMAEVLATMIAAGTHVFDASTGREYNAPDTASTSKQD